MEKRIKDYIEGAKGFARIQFEFNRDKSTIDAPRRLTEIIEQNSNVKIKRRAFYRYLST